MHFVVIREPIKAGAVVTPERVEGEGLFADLANVRVMLIVTPEDMAAFDALPPRSKRTVRVVNLLTDEPLYITRAPCGLGCYCSARIVGA